MKFKRSFSVHLLVSFLISTLIPFMLIAYVVAHIYAREYSRDVRSLLDTTASSLDSNIATYLKELEQVTMQPYYNNELYNYLRGLSRDQDYAPVRISTAFSSSRATAVSTIPLPARIIKPSPPLLTTGSRAGIRRRSGPTGAACSSAPTCRTTSPPGTRRLSPWHAPSWSWNPGNPCT